MKHLRAGFTVVELAIVIVVIAILATITVVAYNSVKVQAIESSMKSDLQNAAAQLEKDRSRNGTYPESGASANSGGGLIASESNTLKYRMRENGYCVSVTSTKINGKSFFKESAEGAIQEGVCAPGPALVKTLAGSFTPGYASGEGMSARFNLLNTVNYDYGWGIDIASDGSVYFIDMGNNVVRKMTPTGVVSTIAGMRADGGEIMTENGLTSSFDFAFDLAVVPKPGSEKLVLGTGACIRTISLTSPTHATGWVNEGAQEPHDGHIECSYVTQSSTEEAYWSRYRSPVSVVVGSDLSVYINEAGASKVRKMTWSTEDGTWDQVSVLGSAGSFEWGTRFGIDPQDRVYGVSNDNKIVRFTSSGARSDFAGSATAGFAEGEGSAARFNNPLGIDVDGDGNVYVADCSNHSIRKITPGGVVSTIAGSNTAAGHVDAVGSAARFDCPVDLAVNADGSVMYVMDAKEADIEGEEETGVYIRRLTM